MNNFACFFQRLQNLSSLYLLKLAHLRKSICYLVVCYYRCFRVRLNTFLVHLLYFLLLSSIGFLVLLVSKPRNESFKPRNLDLFFTSVSAATVSSMSTVEMEVFTNSQLLILTILMFVGGEIFTSMCELFIKQFMIKKTQNKVSSSSSDLSCSSPPTINTIEQVELGLAQNQNPIQIHSLDSGFLKYHARKYLGFVVLGYLLVVHVFGVALVSLYLTLISSAKEVLQTKGLKMITFSVFTTVSTFASCGFIPTNENMMVFSKNSGLLLILIPQVLLGNTLFPSCLRFSIWFLGTVSKKEEWNFLLKRPKEIGYLHLLPRLHSTLLVPTVLGFIFVQFVLFNSMEWSSEALGGLNSYEKIIGVLFQCVNARHTGETIVDISTISSAILVLFLVTMYLPPYTSYLPVQDTEEEEYSESKIKRKGNRILENYIFSQLSYLVIFIILVCITERQKIKDDPINFSVLNIAIEVISAYGNVGFTTGYSCKRQLNPSNGCQDKWYGFSGRWSDGGKIILIVVMFFGRLKKFNMNGGKAWKLL
ncbi:hypothetical protein UlMin_004978 [Ulmus minor]